MYRLANTIYYVLSGFLLMTGLFVLSPSQVPEVIGLQTEMQQQFSRAWQGTIGDQPYFDDLFAVIDGITEFYNQSANEMMALLSAPEPDHDLIRTVVSTQVADQFVMPSNFMAEEPIYNIVLVDTYQGLISGMQISQPVNANEPWVTMIDNFTGQTYCVALYNGEVNKYLGPCENDFH